MQRSLAAGRLLAQALQGRVRRLAQVMLSAVRVSAQAVKAVQIVMVVCLDALAALHCRPGFGQAPKLLVCPPGAGTQGLRVGKVSAQRCPSSLPPPPLLLRLVLPSPPLSHLDALSVILQALSLLSLLLLLLQFLCAELLQCDSWRQAPHQKAGALHHDQE